LLDRDSADVALVIPLGFQRDRRRAHRTGSNITDGSYRLCPGHGLYIEAITAAYNGRVGAEPGVQGCVLEDAIPHREYPRRYNPALESTNAGAGVIRVI
jgi:hypothetical protein